MENKNILIVEDDSSMRDLLEEAFVHARFNVYISKDGEDAIDKIARYIPDVVLLDIILPKKDGFEVLKQIRENPSLKSIPVILLTNLERSEDVERALSFGATTYLVKSNYALREIVEKVKTLV
ncbi:MAG: response regulator [Candidatus Moranbacteria bacterium]|nr:response regulator [Candidatus Moranbacteria bacterium]